MASQQFSLPDLTIWKLRWKALEGAITTRRAVCQELPSFARQAELGSLLDNLAAFANEHFNFFYESFINSARGPHPLDSKYPREYVLDVILEQVAFDLAAIEQIINQRSLHYQNPLKRAVAKADKLAWEALGAVNRKLVDVPNLTVITYLQKSANIRVIPYAPVALIGIPIACARVPEDFLSIPHEVGHYIFWRNKEIRSELGILPLSNAESKSVSSQGEGQNVNEYRTLSLLPYLKETRKYEGWVEEIFADVYAGWIAGPAVALSCQDARLTDSFEKFFKGDAEHPPSTIRPHVYDKILAHRGLSAYAVALDKRWVDLRRKRKIASEKYRTSQHAQSLEPENLVGSKNGVYTGLDDTRPVDQVVSAIVNWLNPQTGDLSWWGRYQDQVKHQSLNGSRALYDDFRDQVAQSTLKTPPELEQSYTTELWEQWAKNLLVSSQLLDAQDAHQFLRDPASVSSDALEHTWITLLEAEGWTTKWEGSNPKSD